MEVRGKVSSKLKIEKIISKIFTHFKFIRSAEEVNSLKSFDDLRTNELLIRERARTEIEANVVIGR